MPCVNQPATDTQDSRVGLSSVNSRVYETESPIVPALNRIRRVSLPGGVSSNTSLSPLTHLVDKDAGILAVVYVRSMY